MTGFDRRAGSSGIVVVSGAGTGIGRAYARSVVSEGSTVLAVGRRASPLEDLAAESGGRVEVVPADLSGVVGSEKVLAAVAGRPVRGVVAAAGGQGRPYRRGADPAQAYAAWSEAMSVNLMPAVMLIEPLVPLLMPRVSRIALISSVAALDGQGGAYASAKAALHGYARDLARRIGKTGGTANVVAPGAIVDTEFFRSDRAMSELPAEAAAAKTLVGRVGTPADVVSCLRWLLHEDSGWFTGQVVSPNGGTHFAR